MTEFTLDPFQAQAIGLIERNHSVLVAAPTGAGKTLIAERAIRQALTEKKKAIYTAPIKALSNQKYRDFREEFGNDRVGIITGDVVINADAEILIMTTEIYRNCLFDSSERIEKTGWVIYDEIHYLDDVERGTVWEEALMFTPEHIRILALSATVPNIDELADWIKTIHARDLTVVKSDHRPVPLEFIYQCQNQFYYDEKRLRKEGYFNRDSWRLSHRQKRQGMRAPRARANKFEPLCEHLIRKDRLPAVYFAFGRRRTEHLAWEAIRFNFLKNQERQQLITKYKELLTKYDLTQETTAQEMLPLLEQGVAYHHAGMLPSLKEVIEQLFTSRLVKMIFTTETFALGINMPARSVIFDELEKFYGSGFKYLTTRDFYQMAGRAGRRGLDTTGTVYCRVQPHHVPFPETQRIIYGKPELIRSQLNTAYATLLNLYKQLGDELLDIYPQTFHYYQSRKKERAAGRRMIENKLALLDEGGYLIREKTNVTKHKEPVWGLTSKGEFAASLFGYELPLAEMQHEGVLERFDETELNILLSGLIYEPRKGDRNPRLKGRKEKIRKTMEHFSKSIHRKEFKFHIQPYTKPPHFQLADVVDAWTNGATFDDLARISSADEGELVRHFRMIIQLLRELHHAPHISEVLKVRARNARELINRDVVDAERQLRV